MKPEETKAEYRDLAEELGRRAGRGDGLRVTGALVAGLTLLRGSLYARLHEDVERILGRDSMFMPVSEKKTETTTLTEIELFQIAESTAAARGSGYVGPAVPAGTTGPTEWYLGWLARLRLGQSPAEPRIDERLADYLAKTPEGRRLAFSTVLARVLPESRHAPLVLFQLFPLAVHIATAVAFGDGQAAAASRRQQISLLPAISDCRPCHGKVLDSSEQCPSCGNPVWKPEWLTAAD